MHMSSRFAFTTFLLSRARALCRHTTCPFGRGLLSLPHRHRPRFANTKLQQGSLAASPAHWMGPRRRHPRPDGGTWPMGRKTQKGGRTPSQMALGRARRTRGDGCGSRRDARHRPCCRTRPRVRQLAGSKLREARNWATPTPKGSQCMHACTHACTHSTVQYSTLQYSTVRPCL